MKHLVPLWDRVMIRHVDTINGIHLPRESMYTLKRGTIEAVGANVRNLKAGDEVFFGHHLTQKDVVCFEGAEYILTPASSILAKVEDDATADGRLA